MATLDIKRQIDGVQTTTATAVNEIKEISTVINSVNEIVATISTSVGEQSAATEEIANNISQAASGLGEVNGMSARSPWRQAPLPRTSP